MFELSVCGSVNTCLRLETLGAYNNSSYSIQSLNYTTTNHIPTESQLENVALMESNSNKKYMYFALVSI